MTAPRGQRNDAVFITTNKIISCVGTSPSVISAFRPWRSIQTVWRRCPCRACLRQYSSIFFRARFHFFRNSETSRLMTGDRILESPFCKPGLPRNTHDARPKAHRAEQQKHRLHRLPCASGRRAGKCRPSPRAHRTDERQHNHRHPDAVQHPTLPFHFISLRKFTEF